MFSFYSYYFFHFHKGDIKETLHLSNKNTTYLSSVEPKFSISLVTSAISSFRRCKEEAEK